MGLLNMGELGMRVGFLLVLVVLLLFCPAFLMGLVRRIERRRKK